MRLSKLLILFLSFFCISMPFAFAQEVSVRAEVNRRSVYLDEPFYFTIIVNGSQSNLKPIAPKFSDFSVLDGPTQSSRTSVVVNNGNMTRDVSITFSYVLQPKKAGTFQINGAGVKTVSGQQVLANNVTIKVLSENGRRQQEFPDDPFADIAKMQQQMAQQMRDFMNGGSPDLTPRQQSNVNYEDFTTDKLPNNIFIRAEVDNTNPVVGEQVNVTYKLYTRLQMSMQPIAMPQLNGFWAQDEEIADPSIPHQENFDGKMYNVFTLRKTALFPQQTGMLTIDPFRATGWVMAYSRANGGYYEERVNQTLESKVITVDVRPLPALDKAFSNGVGQFTITSQLNRNNFSTDDMIQLTLTITGAGNLGLIAAPELILPAGLSAMQPESKEHFSEISPRLQGQKQFVYNISVDAAGDYNIPEVAFTYFDVADKSYKTLKTESIPITVSQGKGKSETSASNNIATMKDIHPLSIDTPRFHAKTGFVLGNWYYWIALLLPVAGFVAMGLKKSGSISSNSKNSQKVFANKEAEKRLATAMTFMNNANDSKFYEEVSKAIWLYLSDKLNLPLSLLNKNAISEQLASTHVKPDLIQKTLQEIETCEMALYTPLVGQQRQNTLENARQLIADFENHFNQKS